jgi:4-amino-4-deoxy-L-arabinose transferase-like glycosyltransferase
MSKRTAAVLAGVAAGIGLRAWILSSSVLGSLDSDEAVKGLMARHALHGEFQIFFWLQSYGGSLEALVTAPFFAVFGSSTLLLKLVSLGFYVIATVVVWRLARRVLGEPRATYAALLFWVAPAFLVWSSTKAYLYGGAQVCVLLSLLLVLKVYERPTASNWAALGFVLGLSWWLTSKIALVALPALIWLATRHARAWRQAWAAVLPFLVGASPWLAWNLRHHWLSLHARYPGAQESYLHRLAGVFRYAVPMWLGVRVPYSLDWLVGAALGIAVIVVALAALAWGVAAHPRALEPLLALVVAFPLLAPISSYSSYVGDPRYLAVIGGVIAILIAWPLRSVYLAVPVLAAALGLSVAGLVVMDRHGLTESSIDGRRIPSDISPLIRTLERNNATRVIANYWLAYRIDFESRERIVATSSGFVRYIPYDREVRADPHPSYVFLAGTKAARLERERPTRTGYRRIVVGSFVVDLYGRSMHTSASKAQRDKHRDRPQAIAPRDLLALVVRASVVRDR